MKKYSILLLVSIVFLSGKCKKDPPVIPPPPVVPVANSFYLNGDGNNNRLYNMKDTAKVPPEAYFVAADKKTYFTVIAENVDDSLEIQLTGSFPGNTPTNVAFGGNYFVNVNIINRSVSPIDEKSYSPSSGKMIITKYDPVGGHVNGTFEGTYTRTDGNGVNHIAGLTKGKFECRRTADR